MMRVLVSGHASGEELLWEKMSEEELSMLASTPALFGGARTFVLRGALQSPRGEEFIEAAALFVSSPHTFIFEEEKLLKAPSAALQAAGAKIVETKKEKQEWAFDQFGLTAALAAKDRKRLWLALMAALQAGEKPEALCGLLCWKARQMKNIALSRHLTFLYHDSHRGAGDLEVLLEKFALTL